MGGIQKGIQTYLFKPSVILGALLFVVAFLSLTPTPISALGNCGDNDLVQGSDSNGKDPNKCYKVTSNRAGQKTYDESPSVKPTTANPTPQTNNNTDTSANNTTPNANENPAGDPVENDEADSGTTCAVEKIGWIICPVIEGAAKISDKAFDVLADNFLRTDPELVRDDSGTKVAWEVARNLANIMFIISFLIIIFSQVTGRGLNNYGIKKMLPRLVIAAIAVNISYYICQLAVDATNIMGYEIQNALAQIANTVGPSVFGQITPADTETSNTGVFTNPGILFTIVTGALALGTVVYFLLGPMLAIIPLILITLATIIIVLLLRKAFIVLLIVLAPIAFVAYLLPNTEKYFSKWLSMFGKLLMVFPIVGLLFGAGQLASTIILVAGSDQGQSQAAAACNPDNEEDRKIFNENKSVNDNTICGEKGIGVQGPKTASTDPCGPYKATSGNGCKANERVTASWTTGLVATGIAVAPLLAVWAVLKGALSAAGAIGGKISGAVERGVGKGVNGSVKGIGDKYKASTVGQMRARDKKNREIAIKGGYYDGKNPLRKRRSDLNGYLNGLSSDKRDENGNPKGFLNNYAAQRGRMAEKDEAEYIRGKAQDAIAEGNYWEMLEKGRAQYGKVGASENDKREAVQKMKIASMAIGNQEGRAGLEHAHAQIAGLSTGAASDPAIIKNAVKSVSYSRQGGGGAVGGGGGPSAPNPNSQTAQQTAARQALNVQGGAVRPGGGGIAYRQAQAGQASKMTDDQIVAATKEAQAGAATGSSDHEKVGQELMDEIERRRKNGGSDLSNRI